MGNVEQFMCRKPLFDTIIMNPPFGTKIKGIDMVFLEKAFKVCSSSSILFLSARLSPPFPSSSNLSFPCSSPLSPLPPSPLIPFSFSLFSFCNTDGLYSSIFITQVFHKRCKEGRERGEGEDGEEREGGEGGGKRLRVMQTNGWWKGSAKWEKMVFERKYSGNGILTIF